MKKPSSTPQRTSWNGLTLFPPHDWDTIIREKRHLIFENELQPVVELRWEPGQGRLPVDKQRERFIRRLKSESRHPLSFAAAASNLAISPDHFDAQQFGSDAAAPADGLLLICTHCRSLVLVKLHEGWHKSSNSGRDFFNELVCQHQGEGDSAWAIQDISFTLPGQFELARYSLSFGMSSFSFTSKKTNLDLCRLAPASNHLKDTGLGHLFELFSRTESGNHEALDQFTLYSESHPGLTASLFARLRRQRPFTAAYFQHVPDNDRILGFRLESARPLPVEMIEMIRGGYGLVQKEA